MLEQKLLDIPQIHPETGLSADYINEFIEIYYYFNEPSLEIDLDLKKLKYYKEKFDPKIYNFSNTDNLKIDKLNDIVDYMKALDLNKNNSKMLFNSYFMELLYLIRNESLCTFYFR